MKQFLFSFLLFACIGTSAQTSLPSYVPADGLVGWWPFNGNANDNSGNGNHGIVTNATLSPDRFGNINTAYRFNGGNSRIDVADAPSLRSGTITIAAWVKAYDLSRINQVVYKGSMLAQGEAYALTMTENGKYHSSLKSNSGCQPAFGWVGAGMPDSTITDSNWHHLVATYNGTAYSLYRDGVLDTSVAVNGLIDSCIGGGLRFGFDHLRWAASTGNCMNGLIDDIGIWNRALSAAEIAHLFAGEADCGYGKLGVNVCTPQRNLHIKDVLRLEPRTTAPDNPGEGDIYYDKTLHKLRVYDGTQWQNCWQ